MSMGFIEEADVFRNEENKRRFKRDEVYYSKSSIEEAFKKFPLNWNSFVKDTISSIKPSDVRPVVHGHYIGEYDGYADENPVYDMWYCSECGYFLGEEEPSYNYCPNCGAELIKDKNNV